MTDYKLEDYKIGWITALPIEAALAKAMLDVVHHRLSTPDGDDNIYSFGQIQSSEELGGGAHNVVIACLPAGLTGKSSAAAVAKDMRRIFPWLRLGLMVGIAGGVWSPETDVRLGDVVVGVHPDGNAGVIQYDHGKALQGQQFVTKGTMNKAPMILLNAVAEVQSNHFSMELAYLTNLELDKVKRMVKRPPYDLLFDPSYVHEKESCVDCNKGHLRSRIERADPSPKIHYGAIASGDRVIRDAIFAEQIRKEHGILCFEMEAAGLDAFPCLVIRGISDYADSHKNDDWHPYAAATAAAYAKELLSVVPPTAVTKQPTIGNKHWLMPRGSNPLFTGRTSLLQEMKDQLAPNPDVRGRTSRSVSVLHGVGGAGKSEAAIKFAEENRDSFWGIFWIDADTRHTAEQGFAEVAQACGLEDPSMEEVHKWLDHLKEPWLLILDNCDDYNVNFSTYFPSHGGSIIVTTRLSECQVYGIPEDMDDLDHEDAILLLLKACKVDPADWQDQRPHAAKAVSLLGKHALALVHAGAYISGKLCTLAEYPQTFKKQQQRLMEYKPRQLQSRYGNVYATFEVSAEALRSADDDESRCALQLLSILAFMNREDVREDLFKRAYEYCKLVKTWYRRPPKQVEDNRGLNEDHDSGPGASAGRSENDSNHAEASGETDGAQSQSGDSQNDARLNHLPAGRDCATATSSDPLEALPSKVDGTEPDLIGQAKAATDKDSASPDALTSESDELSLKSNDHDDERSDDSKPNHASEDADCDHEQDNDNEPLVDPEDVEDNEIDHLSLWHCRNAHATGLMGPETLQLLPLARSRLFKLSLIRVSSKDNTISMHPLVHEWARIRLSAPAQELAWEKTACILALSAEGRWDYQTFTMSLQLHIETCWHHWPRRELLSEISLGVARALCVLGWQLYQTDNSVSICLELSRALCSRCRLAPHSESAGCQELPYFQALCLIGVKEHDKAQNLLQQVILARKAYSPMDERSIALAQESLAGTYLRSGNIPGAISLFELILETPTMNSAVENSDRGRVMDRLAMAYISLSENEKARLLLEEVVKIRPQAFQPNDRDRLISMDRLANTYINLSKNEKARLLLEEVVKIDSRTLQPNDRNRLIRMDRLAVAYINLGENEKARLLLEEVVKIESQTLQPNDRKRLIRMDRLARAYINLNRIEEALPLLEDIVKFHDYEHRLISVKRLARAYMRLGSDVVEKGVPLFEEVLEVYARTREPEDEIRLGVMEELADTYTRIGDNAKAVPLLETLVEVDRRTRESTDGVLLGSMERLGEVYTELENYDKAVPLLEDLVEAYRMTCEPEEESRLRWMEELAHAYTEIGDNARAMSIYQDIIRVYENTRVPDDSARLATMHNIAQAYVEMDQKEKAIVLLEEVVKIESQTLPQADGDRLISMELLAEAYRKAGLDWVTKAVTLVEDIVKIYGQIRSPEDEGRLKWMKELATIYIDLEQSEKTVPLIEDIITIHEKIWGFEDEDRLDWMHRLADIHVDLTQNEKAIPLIEGIIDVYEQTWDSEDEDRLDWMDYLAKLYIDIGRNDKAVSLSEEVVMYATQIQVDDTLQSIYMDRLAVASMNLGNNQKAVELLQRVTQIGSQTYQPDDRHRLISIVRLAQAYLDLGDPDHALPLLEELMTFESYSLQKDGEDRLLPLRDLAGARMSLKEYSEAASALRTLINAEREVVKVSDDGLAKFQQQLNEAQERLRMRAESEKDSSGAGILRWATERLTSQAAVMF